MSDQTTIEFVIECVNIDGFDYTFIDYSDFEEVTDAKFQKLRQAYVDAHKELYDYLETFGELE